MQINLQIPAYKQFRAFYLFFIICAMQLGVAVIGTPRIVFNEAGHDAWLSIILAYLFLIILVLVMIYILKQYENADLLGIQRDLFGSFISKVFGTIYILYFSAEILAALATYIEIIRVFVFPDSNKLILGVMLFTLIIYSSLGGLRVIIGVAFLFMLLSQWIIFLVPQPISEMNMLHFLPVLDRSPSDIVKGTYATAYTFLGVEILFFLYPFIRNKDKIRMPVILGLSWSTLIIFLTTVISIGYFSAQQLERRVWPLLHLFKTQTSPFIERLDYIVVAEWMMVATPKMMLLMWGVTHITQRMYKIPMKYTLYSISGVLLLLLPLFNTHFELQSLIENVRRAGIGIVYFYPFILLPLVIIKKRMRKERRNK